MAQPYPPARSLVEVVGDNRHLGVQIAARCATMMSARRTSRAPVACSRRTLAIRQLLVGRERVV
jgi:hypothetical protein